MTSQGKLLRLARGGATDLLKAELQLLQDTDTLASASEQGTGMTPLHLAAASGHEDCVEALLEAQADALAVCSSGRTPLHCAAQSSIPMCAFQLASRAPAACLSRDSQGQTPLDLAAGSDKGEVLNAMLLACSGHSSGEALASMATLLAAGAVCDTWAPNGSSSLMLAASADCGEGVGLLLGNDASLELQDALGRTALMFAAGNNARGALEALLDRGASVSIRDRRGRNVLDYAAAGSEVRGVLEARIAEMESKAARLQEELLAELLDDEAPGQQGKERPAGSSKKGKKKKGKQCKGKAATAAVPTSAPVPAATSAPAPAVPPKKPAAPAPAEAEVQKEQALGIAQKQRHQQRQQGETHGLAPAVEQLAVAGAASQCPASPPPPPEAAGLAAAAALGLDAQPPSASDWQVVGRRKREEGAAAAAPLQQLSERHLEAAGGGLMRRCPSASSLGSSCSVESHDTAGGSSQRSVLIPPSRSSSAARGHLASTKVHAGGAAGRPAWGKPAAPQAQTVVVVDTAKPLMQHAHEMRAEHSMHSIHDEAAFPPLAAAVQQLQQEQQVSSAPQPTSSSELPPKPSSSPAAAAAAAIDAPSAAAAAAPSAASASQAPAVLPARQQQEQAEAPAAAAALVAEVAALRAELAHLRLQRRQVEAAHQAELACVLEETAAHEAAAVAQAVAAERIHCIYRFAAFLQNNHLATDLLTSHGLSGLAAAPACCFSAGAATSTAAAAVTVTAPTPAAAPVPAGLSFLGFPPLDPRRFSGAAAKLAPAAGAHGALLGGMAGMPRAPSPPPAFCFADLEQRLRTEYTGDVSHFVVPASEAEAALPASLAQQLPLHLF